MRRSQWIVLVAIMVAAAFVAWLALTSRQAPLIPADDVHRTFESASACLGCHGPGAAIPRSPKHPLGEECLRCHGLR